MACVLRPHFLAKEYCAYTYVPVQAMLDTDGNNKLSFEEFVNGVRATTTLLDNVTRYARVPLCAPAPDVLVQHVTNRASLMSRTLLSCVSCVQDGAGRAECIAACLLHPVIRLAGVLGCVRAT